MPSLSQKIAEILSRARQKAGRAVNFIVVEAYWEVGRHIVEEKQKGAHRAEYGSNLLGYLSENLTRALGDGNSVTNIEYMRQFYIAFPNRHAMRDQLSWPHYRSLMRLENPKARQFYLEEAISNGWGIRSLENKQLFASRYKLYLPSEEELRQKLERERHIIQQQKIK